VIPRRHLELLAADRLLDLDAPDGN